MDMMRFNSIITFKYLEVTRNEHTVPSQFQSAPESRQILQPRAGLHRRQKAKQSSLSLTQEKVNPQNITNTYTEDILNSILPPREYTTEKQQLW